MTKEQLRKLRKGCVLNLFDTTDKMFVKFQLNRKDERICWERWVSKDKRSWVNWNLYLSLRNVSDILKSLNEKQQLRNKIYERQH